MKRLMVFILACNALQLPMQAVHAFPCFLTIVKDSCWINYDVTVKVLDSSSNQVISTIIIPKGNRWARESFACQPKQIINFQAVFSPVFWASDQGKIYPGQNYWTLPFKIAKGDTAWSITMCYPEQFAEVPLPPTAKGNCQCNKTGIPPVKPQ